jgi:dienelactone hydrolase
MNRDQTTSGLKKGLLVFLLLSGFAGFGQQAASDIGNFYPFLDAYSHQQHGSMSYLSKDWGEVEQWRTAAKAKMQELLAFKPAPAPLHPEVLSTTKRAGYTQYLVRYSVNAGQKTEAFLLIPDNLKQRAPAVIALHDHGGFYFFGKEKITRTDNQPPVLQDFIRDLYGGRTYADELARRGFVVLCPDAFYFGSQKIDPDAITPQHTKTYRNEATGDASTRIKAFNKLAKAQEEAMAKTILMAGTTWPGIIFQGDRVAVDLLLSRPEVDPQRIGCVGLSMGGLRSTYLFGLDARIKVGVVTAFSTDVAHMLQAHVRHTWMTYVPQQYRYLDLPDVASLNAPRPLLVQNCRQDKLFTVAGMQAAEKKLAAVYARMKAPGHFRASYYELPHSMPVSMQDEAFAWLEQWLKKP